MRYVIQKKEFIKRKHISDGGNLMKNTAQTVAKVRVIEQYRHFAFGCEKMKLHALAAHIFWKLMIHDAENKDFYLHHFLSNVQEAGCKDMSWLFS